MTINEILLFTEALSLYEKYDSLGPNLASYVKKISKNTGVYPSEDDRKTIYLMLSLRQVIQPDKLVSWLNTRIDNFERKTPMDLIILGKMDRLWEMVEALHAGSPV